MPVLPTAVIRIKAVDRTQRKFVATPDKQILVRGDRQIASSNRTDEMDLHAVIFLLYARMWAEISQRKTPIPGLETRKARRDFVGVVGSKWG